MISKIDWAVYNNACWCDTVCTAHGIPGEFHEHAWLNRRQPPRFYPNVVTLSGIQGRAEQQACIQELVAQKTPGSLSIKDSFCMLDLAPLGFSLLFEAVWLWHDPTWSRPEGSIAGIKWAVITDPTELARWELAWSDLPVDNPTVTPARIFLPSLLADTDLAFIAAYQEEDIIAGAIANRTQGVAGLSNVFVRHGDPTQFWAGCLAKVMEQFPGLPVVDYESGNDLLIARSLGFEDLGPLRIWVLTEKRE
jgi:hypothetical protein